MAQFNLVVHNLCGVFDKLGNIIHNFISQVFALRISKTPVCRSFCFLTLNGYMVFMPWKCILNFFQLLSNVYCFQHFFNDLILFDDALVYLSK